MALDYLRIEEIGELTGLQVHQVRHQLRRNDIPPSESVGNAYLYHRDVAAFIAAELVDDDVREQRRITRLEAMQRVIEDERKTKRPESPENDFGVKREFA